jgi:hypothetical protein
MNACHRNQGGPTSLRRAPLEIYLTAVDGYRTQCALYLIEQRFRPSLLASLYGRTDTFAHMATNGYGGRLDVSLQPRRKRAPRKLTYLKCELCREAKVKVVVSIARPETCLDDLVYSRGALVA